MYEMVSHGCSGREKDGEKSVTIFLFVGFFVVLEWRFTATLVDIDLCLGNSNYLNNISHMMVNTLHLVMGSF